MRRDERATSNKTQSTFAVEDRAIRLLREFFADASVDISTVTESKPLSAFYTFHCPVKVSYAAVGPTGGSPDGDPMIEVSHKSSQIEFAGVTSRNNWVSPSLANNLLWESSDGNSSVSMAGIMTPLSLRRDDSRLKMKVQYLVLLHPTEIGLSM